MRPIAQAGMILLVAASLAGDAAAQLPRGPLSGERAMKHVKELLRAGPRTPGSPAHKYAQDYIEHHLRKAYAEVETVNFLARTPRGSVAMKNIIGKYPGNSDDIVVLASHYDTKEGIEGFVGANDGGSSTGLLLELARVLFRTKNRPTVWLVFFDGEEAFRQWGPTDGTYGSRYQAGVWQRDGTLRRLRAFILLDMIGDKNLNILRDLNSTPALLDLIWQVSKEKGYQTQFTRSVSAIEDDHLPFVQLGVPSVDLIDYDYGPGNRYWHTRHDTLDKLSARSLQIVGEVVLEVVKRLGKPAEGAARP